MVIARLLHVVAGIVWVGGAVVMFRFVEPVANELGSEGQRFMQAIERRGVTPFFLIVSSVGIVSGLYLYWRVSGGLQPRWIGSPFGITLTLGALAAIAAFAMGPLFYVPTFARMKVIGAGMAPTGPSEAERTELTALTHKLERLGRWSVGLLLFTAATMASARYMSTVFG